MPSNIELAYIAGLLDGEGTFDKAGKGIIFHPRVRMSSTDSETIIWLHDLFGGGLYPVKSQRLTHKPQLNWTLGGRPAIDLLRSLLPYLRNKHRQAEILIDLAETTYYAPFGLPKGTITTQIIALREPLLIELRTLNHRGNVVTIKGEHVKTNTRGPEIL